MNNHNLYKPNPGSNLVKNDFHPLERGREKNSGFVIGKSSSPAFFTADGHTVHLQDCARGASIMIMFDNADVSISFNGVHNWCLDDACNLCTPDIWTTFKNPKSLNNEMWMSPKIIKIIPMSMTYLKIINDVITAHMPYTFYFRRHTSFNAANFLLEETVWSDNSTGSDILSIIKLAILLGYRNIYLNGKINNIDPIVAKNIETINNFIKNSSINIFSCKPDGIFEYINITEAYQKCILH